MYLYRDQLIAFAKRKIYKIYTKTNYYECIRLHAPIQKGGNLFIDSSNFYFLTKDEDKSYTKLAIISLDMIQNAFTDAQKVDSNKDEDKDSHLLNAKLYYPTWKFYD